MSEKELTRSVWEKDFKKWFRDVLKNAEIVDFRYPIKGFGVWLPYGFKLRENVLALLRKRLDETGHQEVLFPLLIPRDMLAKESEHIAKFDEQCFWVTKGGKRRLGEELALRPTSETAIAPMLKIWIRSHKDLPKRFYQVVNVFRYETKATVPIIRVREVMTFKEAHTSHATPEDAKKQIKVAMDVYKRFFDDIGVPYIISQRPEWDKFPGAVYSIAFDFICPSRQTVQIGTVHNLDQNFSKVFDITFEKADGTRDHIWQTCYGISGRAVASAIIANGDDRGLVLAPNVAPIQVIIVPIPKKGYEKRGREACDKVAKTLSDLGVRNEIDDREELTPGSKFYYWETRGVPIRIEIGPRDVDKKQVTVVRRDTLKRWTIPMRDLGKAIPKFMDEMTKQLRSKALRWMNGSIKWVSSLEEAEEALKNYVVEAGWCGEKACGLGIEEKTGASVLGIAVDKRPKGNCLVCDRKAKHVIRTALTY